MVVVVVQKAIPEWDTREIETERLEDSHKDWKIERKTERRNKTQREP